MIVNDILWLNADYFSTGDGYNPCVNECLGVAVRVQLIQIKTLASPLQLLLR